MKRPTTKRPNLQRAAAIARVEIRRSVRAARSSGTRLLALGFVLMLWVALPTVGGGYLAYRFGQQLPDVPVPLLELARGGTALGWIGLGALAAARAAGKKGTLDASAGILTTVPARDAAFGLVLAEYGRMALIAAIPVVTIAAALAAGAGVVAPVVTVPATAAVLLAVGLAVGFPVGLGIKWATVRSPWLARHRTALLVAAFAVYFLAITSQALNDAIAWLQVALQATPLAWFGDMLLLGLPGVGASATRAVGAAAVAVVALPALVGVGIRAATTVWYAEPAVEGEGESETGDAAGGADHDDGEIDVGPDRHQGRPDRPGASRSASDEDRSSSLAERALSGVVSRPTRTVTAASWRRSRRAPIKLLYVAYPLFFLYAPLRTAFESGVPTSLPVLIALYGTWAAGATVLNPLGDEGSVLPTTVLSGVEGRQFVAGHVLAAALVGVPVVAGATALTGALSPLAPARWLALAGASAVLVVAGTSLAVATGTLLPRFGTVEVFRSREVVVPSKGAFAAYSLVLLAGALGAVAAAIPGVAALAAGLVEFVGLPAIPPAVVRAAGGGLAVLVGVVGPVLSFEWAARRFETFALD